MKYIKKVNNNMALVTDKKGSEWIVVGKGLGFGFKRGDSIHDSQIMRKFRAVDTVDNNMTRQNPEEILSMINPKILMVITEISTQVENLLGFQLSNYNYLALADHINFAIKRTLDPNLVKDNQQSIAKLKSIYPREYNAAELTLNSLQKQLKLKLPSNELDYLTFHYVNAATNDICFSETIEMTKLIQKITKVISYAMQINIDTSSINYTRFITHIRYFIAGQNGKSSKETTKPKETLIKTIASQYPECFSTAVKVAQVLEKKKGWHVSDEETMYLTLHIWRLTR